MRKTDQEKMWEVFVESSNGGVISTGGPLKAGGGSSAPKTSKDNDDEDAEDTDGDSYEDGEDELQDILNKCHSGDITPEEAHKHITKMMKGDNEEDAENVKRPSRDKSIDGFLKNQGERPLAHGKGPPSVKRHSGEKETAKFRKAAGFSGKRTPDVSRDV